MEGTKKAQVNETWKLIKNRRSLRAYSSQPIDDEAKQKIITGAMRAPTGGNMMTYSILEVADPQNKAKLVTTCNNLSFIAKAPLVLIFLADMQRWYDFYQHSDVQEMCTRLNVQYQGPQEGDLMLAICDALIAAQNACIVAESLGMGTCYIGDIIEHIEIHREMFDLPRWVIPITMVCFGYPKRKNKPLHLSPRFDQRYIHFTDKYHRLNAEEFEDMYAHLQFSDYRPGAINLGQHYFLDSITTEYLVEINRSAKKIINDWLQTEKE
jgi:nitroreductase